MIKVAKVLRILGRVLHAFCGRCLQKGMVDRIEGYCTDLN